MWCGIRSMIRLSSSSSLRSLGSAGRGSPIVHLLLSVGALCAWQAFVPPCRTLLMRRRENPVEGGLILSSEHQKVQWIVGPGTLALLTAGLGFNQRLTPPIPWYRFSGCLDEASSDFVIPSPHLAKAS